jgi:hypothetical protein
VIKFVDLCIDKYPKVTTYLKRRFRKTPEL